MIAERTRIRALAAALVVLAAMIVLALAVQRATEPPRHAPTVAPSPSPSHAKTDSSSPAPIGPRHVWLVVLENHSYRQVIGSSLAPTLNGLARTYGLATDYHAIARPSEPNYLALISGSAQGITDDRVHDLSAPTLLDQLERAGLTWRVNAENVPSGCFRGAVASDGTDGPGTYARKHEPAISFTSISGDPARCSRISNLSTFDASAADFTLVIPNLCHDMHDCSVAVGDAWLKSFLPRITGSAAFANSGLLLITFDESSGGDATQHVPLIYAGHGVEQGSRATEQATHYSLLRTIEEAFGLPCLAHACAARPMPELLRGLD